MSKPPSAGPKGQIAVEHMSELTAFTAAVLLFTCGIAVCIQGFDDLTESIDSSRLYFKVLELTSKIQSHKDLIYKYQPSVFEINKLMELEQLGLGSIITIPDNYGVTFIVSDLSGIAVNQIISLSMNKSIGNMTGSMDIVVVNRPVNLHLNGPEIHAAMMTMILWR